MRSTRFRSRKPMSKSSNRNTKPLRTIFTLRPEAFYRRHQVVALFRKYEKMRERLTLRKSLEPNCFVFGRIIDDRAGSGAPHRRKTSSTPHRDIRWIV